MDYKKKIMILGASRGQLGLYRAAKEMDLQSIAVGIRGKYPGLMLADKALFVDIMKPEAVLDVAKKEGIDAIVTSCQDTGLEALALVSETLGLTGLTLEAAKASINKAVQKRKLLKAQVPTAYGLEISSLDSYYEIQDKLGFPVVIKQLSSQGSSGVYIANEKQEAQKVVSQLLKNESTILVEEYINGIEFGAQAFVFDHKILFVMEHGDLLYRGKSPMPIGHWFPYRKDEVFSGEVYKIVEQAVQAIGLNNCAVNVDLFLCADGSIKVIELTGRAGANGLPELVGAAYHQNYYNSIIRASLGDRPSFSEVSNSPTRLVKMVLPINSGVVDYTHQNCRNLVESEAFFNNGEPYEGFVSLKSAIGQIMVSGKDRRECEQNFYNMTENIFNLKRKDVV